MKQTARPTLSPEAQIEAIKQAIRQATAALPESFNNEPAWQYDCRVQAIAALHDAIKALQGATDGD